MPLTGPWTDSTGTGFTYPLAYLVAHARIDTAKDTVVQEVTIWASSSLAGRTPIYRKSYSPNSSQITNIVNFIEARSDESLKNRPEFSGMST